VGLHKLLRCTIAPGMRQRELSPQIVTNKEVERQEEIKVFERAPWFRDEFSILGKKDQGKKHMAPEALYDLDGNKSYKTIHNRHEVQVTPVGTSPRAQNTNKENQVIELNSKEEVNGEVGRTKSHEKEEAVAVNDSEEDSEEEDSSSDDSTGHSASHTSNATEMADDSGNKRSCSKGSKGENNQSDMEALGTTSSG
jgi:hypothetical protein